jgi:hypothetical protein
MESLSTPELAIPPDSAEIFKVPEMVEWSSPLHLELEKPPLDF